MAGDIRDRIKSALAIETERGPLTKLMKAFQTWLVHDLDADGFADMYAQTIAYGLLSARIADPHKKTVDDFAGHMRTNPFLRELMETFLKVGGRRGKAGGPGIDFDELGASEVVQLLDDANMEAVVLDFGDKNPQEDPVIHFYTGRTKGWLAYPRREASDHLLRTPNVALIVKRSRMINVDYFCHICVVDSPPDINYLADQTYFMPLYSAAEADGSLFTQIHRKTSRDGRTHNVAPKIVRQLADALGIRFVEDGAGDL